MQNLLKLKDIKVTEIMTPRVVIAHADENIFLEDFLKNKLQTIKHICNELSIEFDPESASDIAGKQASHNSTRDYQPVGSGSWKSDQLITEADISIVERVCGAQMDIWGYS